jgi:hypothetical protein
MLLLRKGNQNMKVEQHQILSPDGLPPAQLTVEHAACGEQASSLAQDRELPGGAKIEAAMIPGRALPNEGMADLTENVSGKRGFMDEKELLRKLPISRRTLGNWKATGVLPYIKIGRRCLYDWASVQGALLRRQRGGQ